MTNVKKHQLEQAFKGSLDKYLFEMYDHYTIQRIKYDVNQVYRDLLLETKEIKVDMDSDNSLRVNVLDTDGDWFNVHLANQSVEFKDLK